VLLGLSSISPNGGFRRTNFETYGGDCAKNIVVNSGDIYVSLKDVTQSADLLGAVARLPKDISSGRLTQDTVRLIAIRKDTPWDYIYWLLRTPQYRNFCSRYATGTTTLGLGRDDFLGYPVPDFTDQRRFIVQALEAIERRHEELSFQSETLESLARAIFKSWFVDFDPVRAKAEGREPEGMDADTAALFPSTFEDSELGPIPQGWTIHGIDTIATFLNGIALQKYPAMEGEEWLPAIKIAQLKRGSVDGADRISPSIPEKYIVQDGDLLFSWSGSLEVEFWTGGKGALNQHLFKVFSAQFPHWFVYLWLRFHLDGFREIAESKVTTMGHIQRHHLSEAIVVIPPPETLCGLDRFLGPLIEKVVAGRLQARTLADLRDTLLPRLISGKLRVPEAEAMLTRV
jgi:type I restriction enzyme S subunit